MKELKQIRKKKGEDGNTRFVFELVEEEIDGLIFSVLEVAQERKDLVQGFHFKGITSDLELPLHLLPRRCSHLSLKISPFLQTFLCFSLFGCGLGGKTTSFAWKMAGRGVPSVFILFCFVFYIFLISIYGVARVSPRKDNIFNFLSRIMKIIKSRSLIILKFYFIYYLF